MNNTLFELLSSYFNIKEFETDLSKSIASINVTYNDNINTVYNADKLSNLQDLIFDLVLKIIYS